MKVIAQEMAENLKARKQASGLSYKQIERGVIEYLGLDDAPTEQTIVNYHDGYISDKLINLELVVALSAVYDCRVRDLSPALGQRVERFIRIAEAHSDLVESAYRCMKEPAGQEGWQASA